MAKVTENFMMQRRLNGLDVYQAASDLAPGDLSDMQNCYSYNGELYSRWGKQACFVSPPSSSANYAVTEFVRSDGSTVIVFCNDGKLYYSIVGTPPLTWTEIKTSVNGALTSFNLNSAGVQMKKAGKYLYVVDGVGTLYRVNVDITQSVTNATNASPVVVTTSSAHGYANGDAVHIAEVQGNSAANGYYYVKTLTYSSTTFALYSDATLSTPVNGSGAYASGGTATRLVASAVSALDVPGAPSAVLTNTTIDTMSSVSGWSSFPPLSWLNTPLSSSNQNTIGNQNNWQFSGASTSSFAPPPQGWLTGGDTMDFQASSAGGMEPKLDGSGDSRGEWVDWDYPAPLYQPGTNLVTSARVWMASGTTHSGSGSSAFFEMQLYPEAASIRSTQTSSVSTFTTNITGATNATPIVITAANHALYNGQTVTISGVGGNTNANGTYYAGNVATNTFALYSDIGLTQPVAGNGNYTSGGMVTVTGPTAYTDLTTSNGNNTLYSAAHPFAHIGGNQNSGDVGKVITILTSSSSVYAGNYTITSVSSGGVATVDGNVSGTAQSSIVGVMGLDSGYDGSNNYGDHNWTLAPSTTTGTMPSGITGAVQNSGKLTASPSGTAYNEVFTWSTLDRDFDYLKYRIFGPSNTSAQGVFAPSLTPVDVRLNVSLKNGLLHLAANDPLGGGLGANYLAGVWIKKDYTGTTTSFLHLHIQTAGTSESTLTADSPDTAFSSGDVGKILVVTGGSGFTAGNYRITAVNSGTATVSGNIGTAGSTGGTGASYSVQDFSKNNIVSIGYSAPSTTPQIPFRLGILKAGQPITAVIWSNLVAYSADGKSFYVDISTIDASDSEARSQCAYLFLKIETDLPNTIDPADLCTLGPITGAGNLSVGMADYNYVGVEAEDNAVDTSGNATGNSTDGVVLSDPSGASAPSLTPTNYQAQSIVTLQNWKNGSANWMYVYRFGGALAGANLTTYTSYSLVDKCPRWSGGTNTATGWTWNAGSSTWTSTDGYRTWNPSTLVFTDNTPDSNLIGNEFLNNGRGAPPMGASCIELWNNRLVLAKGSTLYISDLLSTDAAAALYYAPTVDPEDPYAVTKGGIYPVEANDNEDIVQLKTHGQYLDIFKPKSVHLLTGQDPVSGFQLTPHLKDAGIGLVGGPGAICAFDLNVAFVGPTAVHEYKAEPIHFSFGLLQAYEDAEQAPIISQKIEPLLAPALKGGTAIASSAYGQMILHYYGRRLWLFAPAPGGTSNSVAYVFDTRPATDGSGPVGWSRHTGFNIVSSCSLSGQNDADALYMGGADGQLYLLAGDGDVGSLVAITGATNATPIVVTAASHGYSNGERVLVSGVGGNAAANGNWYAGGVTTSTFALYQDAGLTQPVAGNGTYTSGTGATGPLSSIAWSVTSRGFMNEDNTFRYFKSNRPTRAYFLLSTQEAAAVTFSVGVVGATNGSGQPPNFTLTETINQQFADVRFKVPSEIRGYGAVLLTVSGSTSTQTRITAFGVEDAKGAIRGNV